VINAAIKLWNDNATKLWTVKRFFSALVNVLYVFFKCNFLIVFATSFFSALNYKIISCLQCKFYHGFWRRILLAKWTLVSSIFTLPLVVAFFAADCHLAISTDQRNMGKILANATVV
jgi:hypothetical protein